jgi:opacity protein-like surface antigen
MKHFAIIPAILMTTGALAATPTPSVRHMVYGGVEGTRGISYDAPFEGNFYIGARGALNFLNFKLDGDRPLAPSPAEKHTTDSYSFERQLGFGVNAGYEFAPRWRAELEYQYAGEFKDSADIATFTLTTQNAIANVIYTAAKWYESDFYVGLGGGAVFQTMNMSGIVFAEDGNSETTKTTFGGHLMLGVETKLTSDLMLGLEYRFGYRGGVELARTNISIGDTSTFTVGGQLTNSLLLGLRYKF